MGTEDSMPRNYLAEASDVIFGNKVQLAELAESDPMGVAGNLFRVIDDAKDLSGPTLRKAAAYALGQLGAFPTLKALKERHARETAPGVVDAMLAAMTAIKLAPNENGHSQAERRQIIEDVYEGRRQPDWG
jgi:hypothetical protein